MLLFGSGALGFFDGDPYAAPDYTVRDRWPLMRPEIRGLINRYDRLAQGERYAEAEVEMDHILARDDLRAIEKSVVLYDMGQVRLILGDDAAIYFREVIKHSCPVDLRTDALWGLARAYNKAGKFDLLAHILETLLDSNIPSNIIPPGSIMNVERNDGHFAAHFLSEIYEKRGDFEAAHEWALAAKYDYAFESFCGTATNDRHWTTEHRVAHTAELIGETYTPAPYESRSLYRHWYQNPKTISALLAGWSAIVFTLGGILLWRRRGEFPGVEDGPWGVFE